MKQRIEEPIIDIKLPMGKEIVLDSDEIAMRQVHAPIRQLKIK